MKNKKNNLKGYDFDGVITEGIIPEKGSHIITGRTKENGKDVFDAAKKYGAIPHLFPNRDLLKNPETRNSIVGNFKAKIISNLGISEFYEDDFEQVSIISKVNPDVTVIHIIKNEPEKIKERDIKEIPDKFIIATQDMAGAGFAKILRLNEGKRVILAKKIKDSDPLEIKKSDYIMKGVCEQIDLDEIFKERKNYKDWIWLWDYNFESEKSDKLREEGFFVFGGQGLSDKMEHDRTFGVELVKKAGLSIPPTFEFNDTVKALKFLDQNEDKAYVFKPDEPDNNAWVTTAPDSDSDENANREIYKLLDSIQNKGSFVLQERKRGIEVNVEMFLYKGTPFFSHANFESKKKENSDKGIFCGCSQDISFSIPLESKIIEDTLSKLIKLTEFKDYTGPVDMNLIVGDNQYWFIEFCARLGYNAHPNLFLNLLLIPLNEMIRKWVGGDIKDFYKNFRPGYGASITLRTESNVAGIPIEIPEKLDRNFYHFNTFKRDDEWFIAGFGNEIGIVCDYDYDIKSAAENALEIYKKIYFTGRAGRTDLDKTDYHSNPIERNMACQAMGLFIKK